MANNDFDVEKMLESMVNAEKYLEKALECDNKELRKRIETISKGMDKLQENPEKRIVKKVVKKSGMTSEMFNIGLMTSTNMFKEALDNFDNNELREFIELYVENGKIARAFFFGE